MPPFGGSPDHLIHKNWFGALDVHIAVAGIGRGGQGQILTGLQGGIGGLSAVDPYLCVVVMCDQNGSFQRGAAISFTQNILFAHVFDGGDLVDTDVVRHKHHGRAAPGAAVDGYGFGRFQQGAHQPVGWLHAG